MNNSISTIAKIFILFVALAMMGALAVADEAEGAKTPEKAETPKVVKTEIPDAVMKAFTAAHPDAEITETSMETRDKMAFYEIETTEGGKETDYVYKEDGTLIVTITDIDVAKLPAAVADGAIKAHPGGEIDDADMITGDKGTFFEVVVELTKGDEEVAFEVVLTAEGTVVSDTQMAAEDEDDETEEAIEEKGAAEDEY